MDVDQLFDFNGTLLEDVAEALATPPPNDEAIKKLEKAASEGDLATLQGIFDELLGTPAGEYWLTAPGSSLYRATQSRRSAVVQYLLQQGVILGVSHANAAVRNEDQALLELFLDYGWNINAAMEWAVPPPLS